MTTMELVDTIERLTHERDEARRMAAAWEQAGANARLTERLVREDLARERESNAARAIEHSRAIVAGIAGAMGLDTSGEGDAIHARILAEHARLTRERDEAREIIEGRTTTPGKEMDAHGRVGGAWLLAPIGRPPRRSLRHIEDLLLAGVFASDDTDLACLRCAIIEGRARPVRWWPLDNDGRPCAWPTVTP